MIWLDNHTESEIVPMYCPALSWSRARPWWCHRSRLWHLPVEWLQEVEGFEQLSSTSASWSIVYGSTSSLLSGWLFSVVEPIANAEHGDETPNVEENDIANLDDVNSDIDSGSGSSQAWSSASGESNPTTTAVVSNASSAASTNFSNSEVVTRVRRWNRKDKGGK